MKLWLKTIGFGLREIAALAIWLLITLAKIEHNRYHNREKLIASPSTGRLNLSPTKAGDDVIGDRCPGLESPVYTTSADA
jgi:hypothetical protein